MDHNPFLTYYYYCSLGSKMRCASYTLASRFGFQIRICISSPFQWYGHSAVMVQFTVLYHREDLWLKFGFKYRFNVTSAENMKHIWFCVLNTSPLTTCIWLKTGAYEYMYTALNVLKEIDNKGLENLLVRQWTIQQRLIKCSCANYIV